MLHTCTNQHAMRECTHTAICASMYMYMHKCMHINTYTCARAHAQIKKLIAACFTQKENTFQFLLTFIKGRIISVNASKYAHTKNLELDRHVTCTKEVGEFSLEKLNKESRIENPCSMETMLKTRLLI